MPYDAVAFVGFDISEDGDKFAFITMTEGVTTPSDANKFEISKVLHGEKADELYDMLKGDKK